MAGKAVEAGSSKRRRVRRASLYTQLRWEVAACGLVNLASEVDVAICRLHYYLQKMHDHKAQLESLWRLSQLQVSALESSFRCDVESYLVGVRQDTARLEAAQLALLGVLTTDSSPSSSSASGGSPRRPTPAVRYLHLGPCTPSPRQPALSTLNEESSRSDSDSGCRREDIRSPKNRGKRKKQGDKADSDSALLAAELGEKLHELKRKKGEEVAASTRGGDSDGTEASSSAGRAAGAGGGGGGVGGTSSSSSESDAWWAGGGTPTSDASTSGGGSGAPVGARIVGPKALDSSQDSFVRMELSPRSALVEIRDQQRVLYDNLQAHSQRLLLVASMRQCRTTTSNSSRRWRQPVPGQASGDPRALKQSVEAAAQELLAVRAPLLSSAEALRHLAVAMDEARPAQAQPHAQQQLRHLPSLRLQPLPKLHSPHSCCPPLGVFCADLLRMLRHCSCLDFWEGLRRFLCSCFCCCCARHRRLAVRRQPTYESTWLLRSPPRGYSTTRL